MFAFQTASPTSPARARAHRPGRTLTSARRPYPARVLLYSHDSFGLGHLRRNLSLSEAIRRTIPGVEIQIVTGSPCASFFACPAGVELVSLPPVTKDEDGNYVARGQDLPLSDLIEERRARLLAAYRRFDPDVVVVDHKVLGLCGEAREMLVEAKESGKQTIFGLRDILDEPTAVSREWEQASARFAFRELYDRIAVYGTPEVFDPRREYPELANADLPVEFTGYVVRRRQPVLSERRPDGRSQVLVTMGGGQDGVERIERYFDSIELGPRPSWDSLVVAGPLMDERAYRGLLARADAGRGVRMLRSHPNLPALMVQSDAVVSMTGYNSTTEILASAKPVVFLPRTAPRREQAIRAERLASLGIGQSLVSESPSDLRDAVSGALEQTVPQASVPSLDGRSNLALLVRDSLSRCAVSGPWTHAC